jgi:hypothetical protein
MNMVDDNTWVGAGTPPDCPGVGFFENRYGKSTAKK